MGDMVHSALTGSIPTEGQPISNARLVAELQMLTVSIHMFGLDGLANMTRKPVQETAETEQVRS